MRQKSGIAVSVGIVVILLVVGSIMIAFPIAGGNRADLGTTAKGPEPSATGTSVKRTVVEVFTGTWCPPCANADPAISRIMDECSADKFILLMYHLSSPDPYIGTPSNTRANFYNIHHVPSAIVDGGGGYLNDTLWLVGAYAQKSQNYDIYRQLIDSEPAQRAPVSIVLAADLRPNFADVTATIHASDPITLANLQARFVLYEDALYYLGSNGAPYHRAVVRDLQERPFTIANGETVTLPASFPLQGTWNRNKLGVALMVQTNDRTPWAYCSPCSPTATWWPVNNAAVLNSARA